MAGGAGNGKAAEEYDIVIIGGGVNGAGIARDAAGRGFSVCLCEAGDFAGGTSSASTKLLHGGLRYLEYFEFRLVHEALVERENLLVAMPHISWPMRFIIPYHEGMRFDTDTPASRLLALAMPWMKGRRPAWMIRLGLFVYDHMGGRELLPATRTFDLRTDPAGRPLKPFFSRAFEYSDCWVDDSRLVILNLRDAAHKGASVLPRTRASRAAYGDGTWRVELTDTRNGSRRTVTAPVVINASGPWVDEVIRRVFGNNEARHVRHVRGSHIVVARKYDHDRCYFFQNTDGRIIFAIPYERDFTLIGTTDIDHVNLDPPPEIAPAELQYLCAMASEYFAEPVRPQDVVWTYSGVRPLFDDGARRAQAATRDYIIRPDAELGNGSLINVFGGKITTYRRLSEHVLDEIEKLLGKRGKAWTRRAPLPGGAFPVDGFDSLAKQTEMRYPFLAGPLAERLLRAYGTEVSALLEGVGSKKDMGKHFGHGLYAVEVDYLMRNEWAQDAEDVLFRRSKLGIRMKKSEIEAVRRYMAKNPRERAGRTEKGRGSR
jgi:glycerol-3-phosphate dehydrogenase